MSQSAALQVCRRFARQAAGSGGPWTESLENGAMQHYVAVVADHLLPIGCGDQLHSSSQPPGHNQSSVHLLPHRALFNPADASDVFVGRVVRQAVLKPTGRRALTTSRIDNRLTKQVSRFHDLLHTVTRLTAASMPSIQFGARHSSASLGMARRSSVSDQNGLSWSAAHRLLRSAYIC
jgi:hypothetical protein